MTYVVLKGRKAQMTSELGKVFKTRRYEPDFSLLFNVTIKNCIFRTCVGLKNLDQNEIILPL